MVSNDLLDSHDFKPGRFYVDGKQVRSYTREQFEEVLERVLAGITSKKIGQWKSAE